jgi:hypothetical protein
MNGDEPDAQILRAALDGTVTLTHGTGMYMYDSHSHDVMVATTRKGSKEQTQQRSLERACREAQESGRVTILTLLVSIPSANARRMITLMLTWTKECWLCGTYDEAACRYVMGKLQTSSDEATVAFLSAQAVRRMDVEEFWRVLGSAIVDRQLPNEPVRSSLEAKEYIRGNY